MCYWLCRFSCLRFMLAGLGFDCSLSTVTVRCARCIVTCCSDWFVFVLTDTGVLLR